MNDTIDVVDITYLVSHEHSTVSVRDSGGGFEKF